MATAVISDIKHYVQINDNRKNTTKFCDLPQFKVRFTTIGIGGNRTSDTAPIGIAIIGYNNYIL